MRLGDTPYTCTEDDIEIRFSDNWFIPASVLGESPLMTCRHCLRHALGYCTREGKRLPYREPLSLRLADGRTFPLRFDCARCEMQVLHK